MLEAFPTLTDPEFAHACQALEARCHDRLVETDWRSVRWYQDALTITKLAHPAQGQKAEAVPESSKKSGRDEELVIQPLEDDCVLQRSIEQAQETLIHFFVILSPIYRVPVLWFQLPPQGTTRGLDSVYSYLVPHTSRKMLRNIGVMGAISTANHPISDLPAFFIHPCNTSDALQETVADNILDVTPERYLLLWLGLIGPSVGLHMPSQLMTA